MSRGSIWQRSSTTLTSFTVLSAPQQHWSQTWLELLPRWNILHCFVTRHYNFNDSASLMKKLTIHPAHTGTTPFHSFLSHVPFTEAFVPVTIYKTESAAVEFDSFDYNYLFLVFPMNFGLLLLKIENLHTLNYKIGSFHQAELYIFSLSRILDLRRTRGFRRLITFKIDNLERTILILFCSPVLESGQLTNEQTIN